ncbi:twin-arginine translocase TatA/TatE family subunit [Brevibacillus sp. B_LB10_24]|uniref:twin-arginine translocase TatA/TatE family subunit n=1 Tax=Brevibacillus sp. B_LB10_24 TaxID=3380645 RepID=UPI0038BB3D0C
MPTNIGIGGFVLLLILALILFGPKKLPELGRAVGNTLKEFKNATRGLTGEEEDQRTQNNVQKAVATDTAVDREQIEKEIRERIERERLEAKIREQIEQEQKA